MNGKKYSSAEAFRAALEARAKQLAKETGEDGDMVRRKIAFQAFLRRVPASGQPVVLKGGYLLHLRYGTGVPPVSGNMSCDLKTRKGRDLKKKW